ncbi:hypothetical protein [Legionella oakridgensis]|uniref:Uncharacterized protein n=2 Tax=Legionella oakridgensis TaxID=29423 RepID=W0BGC8_9GAMM|nr:hypothetical protein [Legionella oakridgensis]AHE67741.1 hypothetical protein Loa_02199 [Legionella oakridgensis ATCC 33761 = DSM 21215]ETO92703.1 hypothetical protein LOR_40c04870 [Legionella oakridgensis RV-2-2007]KTD36930.1 hypothetical protein Loak_2066 [Legionella oakridgensis]STY20761.1 Uncharacterised protein [Legionella longbeachae]
MKQIIIGILMAFICQLSYAHQTKCNCNNNHFCSLPALQTDKQLLEQFHFYKDPAGVAAEAKGNLKDAEQSLQNYANKHGCELYTLSMFSLAQGLLKGSFADIDKQGGGSEMQGMEKKLIILEGDKAVCIKKLGLKLPINIITPSSKNGHNSSKKGHK